MYQLRLSDCDLLSESETAKLYGQLANQADYVHGPFDEDCVIFSPRAPGGIAAMLVTGCLNTPARTVELFRTVKGDLSNRALGVPLMNRERPDGSFSHTHSCPN
jgi:hypothetical protein